MSKHIFPREPRFPLDHEPGSRGNLSAYIYASASFSLILMLTFVSTRLYWRGFLRTSFAADDVLIVVAVTFALGTSALTLLSPTYGMGVHAEDVNWDLRVPGTKIIFANSMLGPATYTFTKLSLCRTYRRLFADKTNKIFCQLAEAYLICWLISFSLTSLLHCIPLSDLWNQPDHTKKRCIDFYPAVAATSATNSLSDFVIYLWPAREIMRVQIPLKQKLGLITIFGVGALVSVCGILHIYYTQKTRTSTDPMYVAAHIWTTSLLGANIGIVCASLHGIRPAMTKMFKSMGSPRASASPMSSQRRASPRSHHSRGKRSIAKGSFKASLKASFKSTHTSGQRSVDDIELVNFTSSYGGEDGMGYPLPIEIAHEHNPTGQTVTWITSGESARRGSDGVDAPHRPPSYGIEITQQVTVDSEPMPVLPAQAYQRKGSNCLSLASMQQSWTDECEESLAHFNLEPI